MLGVFYLFPTVYGVLGRVYAPQLLLTGTTDAVVLVLPGAVVGGLPGQLLAGLVAAGAFAAFLSTSSGLLVSVSGVLSTDVLGRWSGGHGSVRDFRRSAMVAGVVPLLLALQVGGLGLSTVVGLAFAVAASTFCPLLVLGIWWRGLTAAGAGAGLLVGGDAVRRSGAADRARSGVRRLAGRAARPAGGVDGADRVRGHGAGVAGHVGADPGRRRPDDAPAARPGVAPAPLTSAENRGGVGARRAV